MSKVIDTLLLIALPASGKSEVRTYLASLDPQRCRKDFHLGETVQLDDFPYVHAMRVVDDTLEQSGKPRLFFQADDKPFKDSLEWLTLIELINEDYADLTAQPRHSLDGAGKRLIERIADARMRAGGRNLIADLSDETRQMLAGALQSEAAAMQKDKEAAYPTTLEGKTVVIEFARGGPQGSQMPLPAHHGYQHSLLQLSGQILERASALYIWVTPEESRRKNEARADPDDPGSILHHGVPIDVMLNEYGCDDLEYLLSTSGKADTLRVGDRYLPVARFDNRVDKTSFVREANWPADAVKALHDGLAAALSKLV